MNIQGKGWKPMKEKLGNIANLLNQYRSSHNIPGLAMSIVSNGEIIYKQGFGTVSVDNPFARATADTLFPIADITKNFTATALVHLEETTSFSLDVPVIKYLPYFRTKNGAYDKITTKHILSHTAGFPNDIWIVTLLDKGLYTFSKDMPEYQHIFERFPDMDGQLADLETREDITRYFANTSLEDEPGESWNYCTDAYVIAADVLEKLSGLSWETYVSKYILRPMQLEHTYINPTFDVPDEEKGNYYMKGIGEPTQVPALNNRLGAPTCAIYTTVNDMATYLLNHMHGKGNVLSAPGLAKMQAPIARREAGFSHGLGWEIKQLDGMKMVAHAGEYLGVSSFVSMIPERKFGLTLFCNMDTIKLGKLSERIVKRLL